MTASISDQCVLAVAAPEIVKSRYHVIGVRRVLLEEAPQRLRRWVAENSMFEPSTIWAYLNQRRSGRRSSRGPENKMDTAIEQSNSQNEKVSS